MNETGSSCRDRKTILIVNDDGISNKSIFQLQKSLEKYGDVYICVPDGERSGSSLSTYKYEIDKKNFFKDKEHKNTYFHNKSASDSVKFFLKFVNKKIDFVISGVNTGFNLGRDIFYSGTVGAALEANMHGIRSIALSARKGNLEIYSRITNLLDKFLYSDDWHNAMCLNINFPDKYFNEDDLYRFLPLALDNKSSDGENDFNYCRNIGYITITPLKLDLTDYFSLTNFNKEDRQ